MTVDTLDDARMEYLRGLRKRLDQMLFEAGCFGFTPGPALRDLMATTDATLRPVPRGTGAEYADEHAMREDTR